MAIKKDTKLSRFFSHIKNEYPLFWPYIRNHHKNNTESFENLANIMLDWASLYLEDTFIKVCADGYVAFVADVNKSQMIYEKCGHYRNEDYQEVYEDVYNNAEHMNLYHWGVYVTTFAWEHHLNIYQFYKNYFISRIDAQGGNILDLGSGSGIWGFLFCLHRPAWRISGVDISETSVDFANGMSEKIGYADKARYRVGDALSYSEKKQFNAAVSCFVLEHLSTPEKLLENMCRNLNAGDLGFVTGALTASEIDHIKEFRHESELILMAENAGFRVLSSYSDSPRSYPINYKFLPRSMALVLQKKRNSIW